MPRANNVFCVGAVSAYASEKINKEGQLVQVALPVIAIHGTRSYGDRQVTGNIHSKDIQNKGYDTIWIMTKDTEMMQILKSCKPYDIIECKGVIRVIMQRRKVFCPECEGKHVYYSTLTTVYPIYFAVRESLVDKMNVDLKKELDPETAKSLKKEAHRLLKNCVEISNTINITGVVSKEPELYSRASDGMLMLTFPMAVLRKFRVPDDDTNVNTDFPFVKLYGSKAREQEGLLHVKNVITIDGFIMSRNFTRKVECEHCGAVYKIDDHVSEVIPYEVEWIRDNVNIVEFCQEKSDDYKYAPKVIGSEADIDLKRYTDGNTEIEQPKDIVIDPEVEAALQKLNDSSAN